MSTPPFVLVDGSYYLFRAFHALPPLTNAQGMQTNAIKGAQNALQKLIRRYQPTHMVVTFDTPEPTFRHLLSADYKAGRPEMPSELSPQIPYLHALIRAMGIPLLMLSGAEADDLMGTLAKRAEREGYQVLISTGDKDMCQLVNDNIKLEDSFKEKVMDYDAVVEKFGVRPDQIIDYLTLMGDASDGIKGIPKVGAKTAAKWLQQYGTIGGILENIEQIKGAVGQSLRDHADTIPFNHQLASIVCDLPLEFDWHELKLGAANVPELKRLYTELDFRGALQSLEHPNHPDNLRSQATEPETDSNAETIAQTAAHDWQTVLTLDDFVPLLNRLQHTEQFVIDTETTALDWRTAQIVGLSFALQPEQAYYLPLAHDYLGAPEQLSLTTVISVSSSQKFNLRRMHATRTSLYKKTESNELCLALLENLHTTYKRILISFLPEIKIFLNKRTKYAQKRRSSINHQKSLLKLQKKISTMLKKEVKNHTVFDALKSVLENPNIGKIGQHLKYDAHVLSNHGIQLQGWAFDTMLASYVINPTATRHNMDDLAKFYLDYQTTSFEDVAGKGVKQLTFNQIELEKAAPYACEDADVTFQLYQLFSEKLKELPALKSLLLEVEMPTAQILTEMESNGILLDRGFLTELSQRFSEQILGLEKTAHELAGQPFNVASPKQLGEILFDKLGIAGGKKTASGQYATSEAILEKIEHPLAETVLEYRGLSKLKSTYTDALVAQANPNTGRVHTSYHQANTATGRLSSSDPNLQNIPIRDETGRLIRRAFVAPAGRVLLAADYSQIELRLMAHFSQDAALLTAFQEGRDIHQATAAEVLGIALEQVTGEQRRQAKAINFGLLYGMSSFGLSKQLKLSRSESQAYINQYFARYPNVLAYMERTRAQAAVQGYVSTLLGRRLYTPDIQASNANVRQAAERAAINAPLQGSAADIIKLAMIAVDKILPKHQAKMLLQVHDELVFEVDADIAADLIPRLRDAMSGVVQLDVPLLVEIGQGKDWDSAH